MGQGTLDLFLAAALGLGLGVVTGMPLGVVNVAIVDAAVAGQRRRATGIGLGGALADALHAALAFVGIGQLVTRRPDVVRVLAVGAAALILVYAAFTWRQKTRPAPIDTSHRRAVLTGFALTLPNPGALTAWVAVAASMWPDATTPVALVLAAFVGIGSALWFALLARLVARIPRDHRALRILPRAALLAFVAIAIVGVVRAF